jgi:hypothetical protein
MIIVHLMGGIGNQLFQYAAGRALAIRHDAPLYYIFSDNYELANRKESIHYFGIDATPLPPDAAKDHFPKTKVSRVVSRLLGLNYEGKIFREKVYYSFDPAFISLPAEAYLHGFWQSYLYFNDVASAIRKELVPLRPSEKLLSAAKALQSINNPVAYHIRRGDYLHEKSGFSALGSEYFEHAHEEMKSYCVHTPVIFSDDNEWVKEHLCFPNSVYATDFCLRDDEELILMSRCAHQVISNSSFSWWGAWLNENPSKVVIAPAHWHPAHTPESTLIPQGWKRI